MPGLPGREAQISGTKPQDWSILVVKLLHPLNVVARESYKPVWYATDGTNLGTGEVSQWVRCNGIDGIGEYIGAQEANHDKDSGQHFMKALRKRCYIDDEEVCLE